jgi:hypothetical protein
MAAAFKFGEMAAREIITAIESRVRLELPRQSLPDSSNVVAMGEWRVRLKALFECAMRGGADANEIADVWDTARELCSDLTTLRHGSRRGTQAKVRELQVILRSLHDTPKRERVAIVCERMNISRPTFYRLSQLS